ncbi:MAG: DUF721 domain-containing protein [Thermodesulfovibrionales bacterium]
MKSLAEIISPILRESGLEEGVRFSLLKNRWDDLFREPLSLHLYPVSLREGELLVNVDSSVWLQEVTVHKEELLNVLKPYCVKGIRFRLGKVFFKQRHRKQGANREYERELSSQHLGFIDEVVRSVTDNELRDAIRATIEKSFLRKAGGNKPR